MVSFHNMDGFLQPYEGNDMRFQDITAALSRTKKINIALQGGGSHGAFTWGVLDHLLKYEKLGFDGVSGTSAGAINAVSLAAGLMENGQDGAREKLKTIWEKIHRAGSASSQAFYPMGFFHKQAHAVAKQAVEHFTKHMSPYEFNPMDINPLRSILEEEIDFERLRKFSPVKLFIATTKVSSGQCRIFTTDELTVDVVLASTCLPTVFKAIEINGEHYWDGGYSSNPDLLNLIAYTKSCDTLLVQLAPHTKDNLPKTKEEILDNINRITFNQPLCHEITVIQRAKRLGRMKAANKTERRYQRTRFHLIDASNVTSSLSDKTKMNPEKELLEYLFSAGAIEAKSWLTDNWESIGKRPTVDLHREFFSF